MSAATTFSTLLHSVSAAIRPAAQRFNLDRLSDHDLADLNLPPEFRDRIAAGRESRWQRFGGW